jgi:hypothetical protein
MSKRPIIKIGCWVVGAIVAVGMLMPITVRTRTIRTCSLCRAERTESTLLGYSWQTFRDTEFTEWHRAHRPAHEHQWGRLTCTRGRSIFGTTTFFGCGPRHPVCGIPPKTLREFAEHADADALTAFFDGVTSTNRDEQSRAVQMAWDRILESR